MNIGNLFKKKQLSTSKNKIAPQEIHNTHISSVINNPSLNTTSNENINLNIYIKNFDDYFIEAGELIIKRNHASIGILQRAYKIGFNRAARIMDHLYQSGVVGNEEGTKPREILMNIEQFHYFIENTIKTLPVEPSKNVEQIVENKTRTLINDFDSLDGFEFEHFCADLLSYNGFSKIKITQGSGDQGIDILALKDEIKYGIQCKCYSSDIGNKAVQEAFSGKSYYDCHIAVVLTNRYFTNSAKELARKNGVLLWDRDKLIQFNDISNICKESNQKLRT